MSKKTKKLKTEPMFSKNLLGLKFMQRAKKEAEQQKLEQTAQQQPVINPSYQFCERLRFGRLSFKGMNADIEALMLAKSELKDVKQEPIKRPAPPSDSESDSEIDNRFDDDDDQDEDQEEDDEDELIEN